MHGDIKPQNVLIFEGVAGEADYEARVTDFGYSTRYTEDEDTIKFQYRYLGTPLKSIALIANGLHRKRSEQTYFPWGCSVYGFCLNPTLLE